jgi:electron transport complex protein RnfD
MEFGFDNGPHLKDKDRTSKIMGRLFIALIPIMLFSIYKNGILPYTNGDTDFYGAIKPILMFILGIGTSIITEIIYFCLVQKKRDCIQKCLRDSYAVFPGLFLVLTLPLNTPLWLVILGAFVATFIGKLLFGGLGYNIFNPALVGNLFVIAAYGALIGSLGGYLNPSEVDTIAGATPLTNLSVMNHVGTYTNAVGNYGSLYDFLFGFIPGSLGETSKILIILAFLFLAFTKVIKWIIPLTYVFVVFIMTYIIGSINNMDIWYPMFNILSGGLLFGAVFMATDPVTSPTTRTGQLLFGLGLGLLTVIFRYLTPYPEGVLTSILTMNMLVIILDVIGSKSKFKETYKYIPVIFMVLIILGISLYIGNSIKPTPTVDERFHIINKEKVGNKTIYEVSQKGFHGPIEAVITLESGKITSIEITKEEETYWEEIESNNYLDKLIDNQTNIDKVDTVSGATISSNSLKYMITKVLEDYKSK